MHVISYHGYKNLTTLRCNQTYVALFRLSKLTVLASGKARQGGAVVSERTIDTTKNLISGSNATLKNRSVNNYTYM